MADDQETIDMENGVPLPVGSYSGRYCPCSDGKWHYVRITRMNVGFLYELDGPPSSRERIVALLEIA